MRSARKTLAGRVALVAGATRGAGRGIARALAEAGATVYCTGRSVKGRPSAYHRPETITETAQMIAAAGGNAVAVRVDHTNDAEVKALFRRILRAHARLDIVVDSVAGEDPLMGLYGSLWEADVTKADAIFRQGLTSRIITARHAALAMMPARRGLIIEVTENDMMGGGGNPMAQAVKMGQNQPVVASILILDNEGLLRNGASPNLPADYLTAIDRIKPDPHLGTCAAVAATGKRVVTRSFTDDNKWAELRHLPLAIGFLGAWSEPILASTGEVLGTFGTYFRQQREPTEQEIAVVEALVPVAARALASARAGTG